MSIVGFPPTFLDVAVFEGFIALILAGQGGSHLFLDSRHCLRVVVLVVVVDVSVVVVVGVGDDESLRKKKRVGEGLKYGSISNKGDEVTANEWRRISRWSKI